MKKEELHKVETAMQPLLRFLQDTERGAGWHDAWRRLWAHAAQQINALEDKPAAAKKQGKK